jgi:hypothetical protein
MILKLHVNYGKFELDRQFGITDWGSYNTMPKPFEEISRDLYRGLSLDGYVYLPMYIMYKQVTNDIEEGCTWTVVVTVYHDHAVASARKYTGGEHVFKYYTVGCVHDIEEMSQTWCRANHVDHFGHYYHVYKCTKCGFISAFDTSN